MLQGTAVFLIYLMVVFTFIEPDARALVVVETRKLSQGVTGMLLPLDIRIYFVQISR
jgi:hypothetical protein